MDTRKSPPRFTYDSLEPLDPSVDSLRILIIEPGSNKYGLWGLECRLENATFASKPKYEALSYRWDDPSDGEDLTLNDLPFRIGKNLYQALLRLRHPSKPRRLWADAICINQLNFEERNRQVELMSFIYRRASTVLVWLGLFDLPSEVSAPSPQEMDGIVEPPSPEQLASLEEPPNLGEMCRVSYWTRVWIVQEISLASEVRVCWGSTIGGNTRGVTNIWGISHHSMSWEKFSSAISSGRIDYITARAPHKLALQRKERHGDASRLENLIRTFVDAECQEPRDKIYGFLGLAHDCTDGTLKVDYSKRLFKLYEEVIIFHSKSKSLEWGLPSYIDRPMQLVRFSQILQESFKGCINDDAKSYFKENKNRTPILTARGLIEGVIIHLGPSYTETMASSQAERQWKTMIEKQYDLSKLPILRQLREMDAAYTNLLLAMEEDDLAQIRDITLENHCSTPPFTTCATPLDQDWKGDSVSQYDPVSFDVWSRSGPTQYSEAYPTNQPHEPRRFLASNSFMGLAPPGAREGDLICRFHECDLAIVLRRRDLYFDLVGRADCATRWTSEDKRFKLIVPSINFEGGGVVAVKMDVATLQILTCDKVVPGVLDH